MRSIKLIVGLSLLLGISANTILPALAMPSPNELVYAIKKKNFLAPGTALNIRIDKDQVFVSTFRHANAEENDCKIDAALIGKAVLDAAPDDVARVTCYFYGKDMSGYLEVSVSAGDIKAFGSGQLSNDKLLASLAVKPHSIKEQSESDKVSTQLENNTITRPSDYRVVQDKPDSVVVYTNLDPWVSDDEARLEALRVATNAFQAQQTAITVKVIFNDPAQQADSREFDFATEHLGAIWKGIQSAVGGITAVRRPVVFDIQSLRTLKGPEQENRDALLAQLKEMDKKGIGVTPFVKAFLAIEQSVKRETDAKYVSEMVGRLKTQMDDQMKAYTTAKEKKAKAPEPVKAAADTSAPAKPNGRIGSRWDAGALTVDGKEALANPDAVVAKFEAKLGTDPKSPEARAQFVTMLKRVAGYLQQNNRAAEADKYLRRAQQMGN